MKRRSGPFKGQAAGGLRGKIRASSSTRSLKSIVGACDEPDAGPAPSFRASFKAKGGFDPKDKFGDEDEESLLRRNQAKGGGGHKQPAKGKHKNHSDRSNKGGPKNRLDGRSDDRQGGRAEGRSASRSDGRPGAGHAGPKHQNKGKPFERGSKKSKKFGRDGSRDSNSNSNSNSNRDDNRDSIRGGIRNDNRDRNRDPNRDRDNQPRRSGGKSQFTQNRQRAGFSRNQNAAAIKAQAEMSIRGANGGPPGAVKLHNGAKIVGVVKRHPDGFGFLIPDAPGIPDVYVSRQYMTGVMTNDRVEIEIFRSQNDSTRWFGEVNKIVSRAVTQVVGKYLPVDVKYGVIQDEGKGWGADLRILSQDSLDAKEGDLVAVDILTYPGRSEEFTGKVKQIIGDIEDPLNDVRRVIFQHHIPHDFSPEAVADARKYGHEVREEDIRGRVDLRAKNLITIDGVTARDFDDAICVETTPQGFKLWVAIADVSHYVLPGTKLDLEAYDRGTSTYFPNFVVPMLPEELSNELCSLKPNVTRLCFVCEMLIDFKGEIIEHKFYEAVMESKARVTYGEAQEVLDGMTPARLLHVEENIRRAADLAKILMTKRFAEGSLDLEIPETQVVVDQSGQSVDIIKSERIFAHRLIEELMLAANISVARFIDGHGAAGLYRVHEEPNPENIEKLQKFLWNFGGRTNMMAGKLQKNLTKALHAFDGRPESQILNILTLRTMNQAKYSPNNLGHFGLGFSHYAHFTSPIRRYPDLITHRITKSLIYQKYQSWRETPEQLATDGNMLSACEQRSAKAERQLISIKKARFIGKFVGQEFDGVISSVAKFGIFVLLRTYDVDGLVKVEELGDDRFQFDDQNLTLIGQRRGRVYKIGDAIRVQVASVDAELGRIEFVLAEESEGASVNAAEKSEITKESRQDIQERRPSKDDRRGVREKRISKRRGKS